MYNETMPRLSKEQPMHIIIYSHGFGVQKDDRGLFTDIAAAFPDAHHVMFDYNEIDEANNTLVVAPLDAQAARLNIEIARARAAHPDVTIDIIAHSQGCVAAALAVPTGVRTTILLAPPAQFLGLDKREIYARKPDTITESDGRILNRFNALYQTIIDSSLPLHIAEDEVSAVRWFTREELQRLVSKQPHNVTDGLAQVATEHYSPR